MGIGGVSLTCCIGSQIPISRPQILGSGPEILISDPQILRSDPQILGSGDPEHAEILRCEHLEYLFYLLSAVSRIRVVW
jgi:hypothetical protein